MSRPGPLSILLRSAGALLLLAGIAVFLIRLQHAGPYASPQGGNLRAALLAIGLGALAIFESRRGAGAPDDASRVRGGLRVGLLVLAPLVFFFAAYSTLAELEEVIVLKPTNQAGEITDLRLWVVDDRDAAWVTMPRAKAQTHRLDGSQMDMLREGTLRCVRASAEEDRETVNRIHHLRHDRYRIQRLATHIGIFGEDADPNTITLRLDPC